VVFVTALLAVGGVAFFATRRRVAPAQAGLRLVSGQASPGWVALNRPHLQLGRGQDNDVVIVDKDGSRHHARVLKTTQGVWLEDMQSTNGTYVNGQPVTRQQLQPGDIIQVGRTQFRFEELPRQ
jgi:pSer/pThr/pTyr-binding forkhead associated (FHA) protein